MHTQVTQQSDICSLLCVKRHLALAQNRKTYGFRLMLLFKQGKGHNNQKPPKTPLDLGVFTYWSDVESPSEFRLYFVDQLFRLNVD